MEDIIHNPVHTEYTSRIQKIKTVFYSGNKCSIPGHKYILKNKQMIQVGGQFSFPA